MLIPLTTKLANLVRIHSTATLVYTNHVCLVQGGECRPLVVLPPGVESLHLTSNPPVDGVSCGIVAPAAKLPEQKYNHLF